MMDFASARAEIVRHFNDRSEGEIRHVYVCNIAMLLHDVYDVPVELANKQAESILDLCFSDD